jgi:hypothetical protein
MIKNSLMVVMAVMAASVISSCSKVYDCECTDHNGTVTMSKVEAKSKMQANKKCDEQGELSNCELK